MQDLDELSKIYNPGLIDKKVILANIEEMLQTKKQVSLSEVILEKGISKGLAELLAYIALTNTSGKFFINTETSENILFDESNGKYIETPQVIFTK